MPVTFMFSCLGFKVMLSVININHNSGILILLEIQINAGYTNINRGSKQKLMQYNYTYINWLQIHTTSHIIDYADSPYVAIMGRLHGQTTTKSVQVSQHL